MAWGAAIAAGASLASSALANRSAGNATAASVANSQADRELQREFAQMGVRWRVADAKAAGLHPLAALGMQPASASPSTVFPQVADYSGIADAGQHIGRAINATSTAQERNDHDLMLLQKERGFLENELLRSRIAQLNAAQNPPLPSAVPGVNGSDGFNVNPVEIPAVNPQSPTQMQGAQPGVRFERTAQGFIPHPNKELVEDADLTNIAALEWYFRNRFVPAATGRIGAELRPPPDSWLPRHAKGWRMTRGGVWRPAFDEGETYGPWYVPRRGSLPYRYTRGGREAEIFLRRD